MSARPGRVWAVVVVGVVLTLLGAMLAFVVVLRPRTASTGCGDEVMDAGSVRLASGVSDLSAVQRANAGAVIAEGRRRGLPEQAIVVALAVAGQESGFENYADDGVGGDLSVDQLGIEQSLELPHEAVGTEHGSLGVFQQQWPWWGTMTDLMDPI